MPPASNENHDANATAWIGQNINRVVKQLGEPTQSRKLIHGGQLVIYSKADGPRYVFQTETRGKIVNAARIG
jgi:hypothetical protein